MSNTKKISINPAFFNLTKSKRKSKSKKQKPDFNLIKPNTIRQKLIQKVKQHKNNELQQINNNKSNNNYDNDDFKDNFKDSIDYLQSLSKKHEEKKLEKRKKRLQRKNKTMKKHSSSPAPPYGILKNGRKPTYSQYRASLKNKNTSQQPIINQNIPVITDDFYDRKNTLLSVKNEFNKLTENKNNKQKVKIKQTHTKTKKRIHLGKKGGNVGILIKNRKTRKKVKKEVTALKNKSLVNIKKYLKKHNLIKVGSNAPENIVRSIYENSYLAGDVYNKNGDILLHNFTQD